MAYAEKNSEEDIIFETVYSFDSNVTVSLHLLYRRDEISTSPTE
jgi:hypothetical protein